MYVANESLPFCVILFVDVSKLISEGGMITYRYEGLFSRKISVRQWTSDGCVQFAVFVF